jgi:hypothetical protein
MNKRLLVRTFLAAVLISLVTVVLNHGFATWTIQHRQPSKESCYSVPAEQEYDRSKSQIEKIRSALKDLGLDDDVDFA